MASQRPLNRFQLPDPTLRALGLLVASASYLELHLSHAVWEFLETAKAKPGTKAAPGERFDRDLSLKTTKNWTLQTFVTRLDEQVRRLVKIPVADRIEALRSPTWDRIGEDWAALKPRLEAAVSERNDIVHSTIVSVRVVGGEVVDYLAKNAGGRLVHAPLTAEGVEECAATLVLLADEVSQLRQTMGGFHGQKRNLQVRGLPLTRP